MWDVKRNESRKRLVVLGVALAAGGVAAYIASGHHEAAATRCAATADRNRRGADRQKRSRARTGDRRRRCRLADVAAQPRRPIRASSSAPTGRTRCMNSAARSAHFVAASGEPIREPSVVFAKGSGFLAAVLPKRACAPWRWMFRPRALPRAASYCPTIQRRHRADAP